MVVKEESMKQFRNQIKQDYYFLDIAFFVPFNKGYGVIGMSVFFFGESQPNEIMFILHYGLWKLFVIEHKLINSEQWFSEID